MLRTTFFPGGVPSNPPFPASTFAYNAIKTFFSLSRSFDPGMPVAKPTTFKHRSLHFPRDGTRQHHIIIIIIVSASVGGVLITLLFWRLLARSSPSSRSAPLPPRQALVHQRERQLAAFTVHQSVSVPRKFLDTLPSSPVRHRHGSNTSLIPHVENSSANNSYRVSLYTHETDDGIEGLSRDPLHPPMPHFFAPHPPLNVSSSHISETTCSTSVSRQSLRRTNKNPRSRSRTFLVVSSNGTPHTGTTARSRSSIRGMPHAPHNNVQIVLPAPLSTNLYQRGRKPLESDNGDNWRSSLADKWIPVGICPEPKYVKRQASHDLLNRRGRQAQSERVFCCFELVLSRFISQRKYLWVVDGVILTHSPFAPIIFQNVL